MNATTKSAVGVLTRGGGVGYFGSSTWENMATRASSVRMSLCERNCSLAIIFPASRSAFRNLDADWPGVCMTFFRFTLRAAGRPHCVNTPRAPARPASSALISLACRSIVAFEFLSTINCVTNRMPLRKSIFDANF